MQEEARCFSSLIIKARARRKASRPGSSPSRTLAERGGNFSAAASSLTGTVNGPVLGVAVVAAPRLSGLARRGVLHPGLHQSVAVRAAGRDHSDPRVVIAGAASSGVHPVAQYGRCRLFDRRFAQTVRDDKGSIPHRRQYPARSAVRVLLRRRLSARQPVSRRARRRQCPGFRCLDDWTGAAPHRRQQQSVSAPSW